jgi:hypothetical protein
MSREGTPGSRKPRKAAWRELPPDEMAAHLIATPTISDGAWSPSLDCPARRARISCTACCSETPGSWAETPAADHRQLAGLKPAGLKSGYYLLNTDGATPGTRQAARRSARFCARAVWLQWLKSRSRSVLPLTTWRSIEHSSRIEARPRSRCPAYPWVRAYISLMRSVTYHGRSVGPASQGGSPRPGRFARPHAQPYECASSSVFIPFSSWWARTNLQWANARVCARMHLPGVTRRQSAIGRGLLRNALGERRYVMSAVES